MCLFLLLNIYKYHLPSNRDHFQLFQNENDVLSAHVFPVEKAKYGSANAKLGFGPMQNSASLRCMAGVLIKHTENNLLNFTKEPCLLKDYAMNQNRIYVISTCPGASLLLTFVFEIVHEHIAW